MIFLQVKVRKIHLSPKQLLEIRLLCQGEGCMSKQSQIQAMHDVQLEIRASNNGNISIFHGKISERGEWGSLTG